MRGIDSCSLHAGHRDLFVMFIMQYKKFPSCGKSWRPFCSECRGTLFPKDMFVLKFVTKLRNLHLKLLEVHHGHGLHCCHPRHRAGGEVGSRGALSFFYLNLEFQLPRCCPDVVLIGSCAYSLLIKKLNPILFTENEIHTQMAQDSARSRRDQTKQNAMIAHD